MDDMRGDGATMAGGLDSEKTPVMRQYAAVKKEHPDALVLFRLGDFYEVFGEDAVTTAGVLQITLTKRRTSRPDDPGIPMCGVPYHAAEGYIGKLLDAGYRVALVEQTETPEEAKKARGSSALVNRAVARLYTPGTLTEDVYLGNQTKLLVAVLGEHGAGGTAAIFSVAQLDLSGGTCAVEPCTRETLGQVLGRLPIGEVLCNAAAGEAVDLVLRGLGLAVTARLEETLFQPGRAEEMLKRAYGVHTLDGFGLSGGRAEQGLITALGALLAYAELTQVGKLPPLRAPVVGRSGAARTLAIDPATRRSLELSAALGGSRADSLVGVLDDGKHGAVTGPGSRLLARWVNEPLVAVAEISARQDAVAFLVDQPALRTQVRQLLGETGDVARCVSRLLLGRGGPRDLFSLRQTGGTLPSLRELLRQGPALLDRQAKGLDGLDTLTALLGRALPEDADTQLLPLLARDGNFIKKGFDAELDACRELVAHGNERLAALEQEESGRAGAIAAGGALKLRYNQVWGYFFEVSKSLVEKHGVPGHFIHRQTTTSTHRYTTEGLMTLERQLGSAGANAQKRECLLFEELVAAVRQHSVALLDVSLSLATSDVLATLAEVAARKGWVRPLVDDSAALEIEDGCHPVVSGRVADFIANSCDLSGGQLWLITGPNMAGKSTFLRQNALLVILAQLGSFVPARRMRLGVCDQLFSRIGAADNLAAGQSTFMVEMVEAAAILNRATARSLVILDELGRGTATYDGLAIAWACVERLAQTTRCRTLFATHYHELTTLEQALAPVSSHQVAVKPWQGEVIFLHTVIPGAAAGSFGLQVAKLAGVPQAVVQRADALLKGFEKTAGSTKGGVKLARVGDLSLFSAPAAVTPVVASPVAEAIRTLDVDALTPKQALDELYRLKGLLA